MTIIEYQPAICNCGNKLIKTGKYKNIKGTVFYFKCKKCKATSKTKAVKI